MLKRIIAVFLLACSALCVFAGCSVSSNENKVKATAAEVYEDVLAVSGFGQMTAVPKRDYIEVYGIDANNFADCAWYTSDNPSLNADEVLIFRLERESYLNTLISLLNKHLETRLKVAESYSPEEAGKIKQAEVFTVNNAYGLWVYYCIGENYTDMISVLKADIG